MVWLVAHNLGKGPESEHGMGHLLGPLFQARCDPGNNVLDGGLALCSWGEQRPRAFSHHTDTGVAAGEIDEAACLALKLL